MALSQRQHQMVQRYLNEAETVLAGCAISERQRDKAMTMLRDKTARRMAMLSGEFVTDEEVTVALAKLGSAEQQAQWAARQVHDPRGTLSLDAEGRVWLGVCAGAARYLDLPPWTIRTAVALLGCVLGPFALLAYLGVFIGLYVHPGCPALPRLAAGRAGLRAGAAAGGAVALYVMGHYLVRAVILVHEQVLKRPMPRLGEWGWLPGWEGALFFWTLLCCVPLMVLSAMPVPSGWDHSLKRLGQAGLALYGIVLSFGIASYVVGLILDFVGEFSLVRPG